VRVKRATVDVGCVAIAAATLFQGEQIKDTAGVQAALGGQIRIG